MASSTYLLLYAVVALLSLVLVLGQTEDEKVRAYLEGTGGASGYNERYRQISNQASILAWAYNTNITDYNQQQMTSHSLVVSEFAKNESIIASQFNQTAITDPGLLRQVKAILDVGISGYDDTVVLKLIADLEANMTAIYSSAKWCPTDNDCKSLEPDLTNIMTTSRDYDVLKDAWEGWRNVSGAKMRAEYQAFVENMNVAIKAGSQYSDMGAYYRSWYEQETFEDDVKNLFDQLSPLYDQLHAYVRRKLREYYGDDKVSKDGHMPAHLFGNMWAQSWNNIYDILEPYPGQGRPSLTDEMKRQNYTITQMYEVAEEFFETLDMQSMPDTFWTHSMLEKPDGREVVCHASAWDFNNGTDFRIKQCTEVTEDQFNTVHHEMGHLQYYLEYINQPILFRGGANPGFHEGVADIASLSFQTPEHLKEIGLLEHLPNGTEGDINFLFQMALDKVAFLPFGYLIDQWRWGVYRGETTPSNYNAAWWDLRCRYQGIAPPVVRSENDFDPGAKYHIPANTPYIRYFVSFVAQFQWHKALCELIGKAEPLHRCDIYRNLTAGARLKEMLQMGSSRPWGEAMLRITNGTSGQTDKLNAQALLDYFKPLQEWLTNKNAETNEHIGWDKTKCPPTSVPAVQPRTNGAAPEVLSLLAVAVSMLAMAAL